MLQVYPDAGLVTWLTRMVAADVKIHLFTNNVTPSRTTVLGDLTEAAWTGYSIQAVAAAAFTTSGVSGHIGSILAAPVTFTNGSGGSVNTYGYFVTDNANAVLLSCGRFDSAPIAIAASGTIQVIPLFGNDSLYP